MVLSNYEYVKRWRKKNKEKLREQWARRYKKKPEKYAEASARYWEKHKERMRPLSAERAAKRRANDPEGAKMRSQKFQQKKHLEREKIAGRPAPPLCEICAQLNIRIVFDHCHSTGVFRGWICDRCNRVLGLIKDDPQLLDKMSKYLRSNKHGEIDGEESCENSD